MHFNGTNIWQNALYFDIKTGRVDLLTYFTVSDIYILVKHIKIQKKKSLPLFLVDIKFNFTHSACIFE